MYNVSYRKENLALITYTFIPTSLEILFINLGGALVNQCEIDLRLVDIRIVSNYSISNGNRENTKKKHAKSIFGTLTLLWDVVGIMSHTDSLSLVSIKHIKDQTSSTSKHNSLFTVLVLMDTSPSVLAPPSLKYRYRQSHSGEIGHLNDPPAGEAYPDPNELAPKK